MQMNIAAPSVARPPRDCSRGLGSLLSVVLHATMIAAVAALVSPAVPLPAAPVLMVSMVSPAPEPEPARTLLPQPKPKTPVPPQQKPPLLAAASDAPPSPAAPSAQPPAAPAASAPVQAAPTAVVPPRFDAAYLDNPAPPYPPLSRRMGEQGTVILRVLVSPAGNAQQVELKSGSGSPRLDQSAVETVKRWRFVPARLGADAVAAWVLIPIAFSLGA